MTQFDAQQVERVSLSDVGRQRSTNQDRYGSVVGRDGSLLLMVADGMGGHAGGATASGRGAGPSHAPLVQSVIWTSIWRAALWSCAAARLNHARLSTEFVGSWRKR